MNKKIIITDPMSSSEYLLRRLQLYGFDVVALKTKEAPNNYLSYEHLPYDDIISLSGKIEDDLSTLSTKNITNIASGFYGSECSVSYADKLFSRLIPEYANAEKTSKLRFDKFEMNEKLKNAGLLTPKQHRLYADFSTELLIEKAIIFFYSCGKEIVIKPASNSLGTFGVSSPKTEEDIVKYFNMQNHFLFSHSSYVLQEKIKGEEFFVNAASFGGEHCITGIGKYTKCDIGNTFAYSYADQYDILQENLSGIKNFTLKVLDLLEMRNGLSHLELIYTNGTYFLLELNPRIAGGHGFFNILEEKINGKTQIDQYLSKLITGSFYDFQPQAEEKHWRIFYPKNILNKSGYVDASFFNKLASVKEVHISDYIFAKDIINNSIFDELGTIVLANSSYDSLEEDTQCILAAEACGSLIK